jgi:transcriptional regulator
MFENEDAILPEGFEDDTDLPQSDDTIEPQQEEQQIESEESGAQEEATLTDEQQVQLLKLKYNGEEKEIPLSEATILAQKGMNYDKVQTQLQELQNDPGRQFLQSLAKENGFDNINDFITDFKAMQEQSRIDDLIQQNVPEQYAREMIENQKFREQFQQQQEQKQREEQEKQEYVGLIDAFREFNDRDFNPTTDAIPDEVFQKAQEDGIPLKYAYTDFMNNQLKQQLSIYKQNEQNLKRNVTGGTTQHGSANTRSGDDFEDGFDSYFK